MQARNTLKKTPGRPKFSCSPSGDGPGHRPGLGGVLFRLPALVLAAALCSAPALAEKPDHAGGPKHDKHADKAERKADKAQAKAERDTARGGGQTQLSEVGRGERMGRKELQPGAYFSDRHRSAVRTYYAKACPPGLAKKNNGCRPPGQAKQWNIGQPLPPTVTVYSVPRPVLIQLPPQPPGYRYVQVSTDILLISITTRMVVDGMTELMMR